MADARRLLLVFEPDTLSADQIAHIDELAPDHLTVLVTQDQDEIESVLDQVEIAVGGFPRKLIPGAENLRWFQLWSAGADWLQDHPAAAERDFILTSASGVHPIQITEHIFAFLLSFARGVPQALRAQQDHQWRHLSAADVFELAGKRMVLVGVGAIGARTAEVARAMGMSVVGVKRDPSESIPGIETMVGPDQLLGVLPEADVVVLTVPYTAETEHMIDERALRAMKPAAYLINIGRGQTVDESALVRALEEGWIAGAGLDVFAEEPLPEDSPLWDIENVIITGHYAGISPHYDERAMAILLENLERYREGQPLKNVVDKRLGY